MVERIEICRFFFIWAVLNSHPLSQQTIEFDALDSEDLGEGCRSLHGSQEWWRFNYDSVITPLQQLLPQVLRLIMRLLEAEWRERWVVDVMDLYTKLGSLSHVDIVCSLAVTNQRIKILRMRLIDFWIYASITKLLSQQFLHEFLVMWIDRAILGLDLGILKIIFQLFLDLGDWEAGFIRIIKHCTHV